MTSSTGGPDDNAAQAGHIIAQTVGGGVCHTLTAINGCTEDGTGRGTPIVAIPIDMRNAARDSDAGQSAGTDIGEPGDPSFTVSSASNARPAISVTPLALRGREHGAELEIGPEGGPYNALRAGDGGSSRQSLIALHLTQDPISSDVSPALGGTVVRRLTPTECERLQGYNDGWTEGQADSARYRQLGNSVAVPVVTWIAERMVEVDRHL